MLNAEPSWERIPIFLEAGQFSHPTGAATIKAMGEALCRAITGSDSRLAGIEVPKFDDALSPLVGFLEEVRRAVPGLHILIVLDEFDELPPELLGRGDLAKAMFLTIRAVSNDPHYGFVIVGGENLQYVINEQGARLNKFKRLTLTYFDRRSQWSDFCDLVRRPVQSWLDVSDAAIDALWNQTEGHPYYTKLVCQRLFCLMVERRDGDVTETEVNEAVALLIPELGVPIFQHFWEDGIAPDHPQFNDIRLLRKRILLALSESGQHPLKMGIDEITNRVAEQTDVYSSREIKEEIKDLCRREVLTDSDAGCVCRVPLFSEWLGAGGAQQILVTFGELTPQDEFRLRQERNEITPQELARVLGRWGSYRGRERTSDDVRSWLNQFGSKFNQRLMFALLQSVRFYSSGLIREKLRDAQGIVDRDAARVIEGRKLRRDIIISYIGGVGKSGVQIARLYAEENGILLENVIERGKLAQTLSSRKGVKTVVFVDDFVGTGNTVIKDLAAIESELGNTLKNGKFSTFFIAVVGFADAKAKIDRAAKSHNLDMTVHFCDVLDQSARAFSEESDCFADEESISLARSLAYEKGSHLVKNNPLGYGAGQMLIVFDSGCPNNSLPILWNGSGSWVPLFPRTGHDSDV